MNSVTWLELVYRRGYAAQVISCPHEPYFSSYHHACTAIPMFLLLSAAVSVWVHHRLIYKCAIHKKMHS